MKTLQFRCKLLSDIVLNAKAATEGNQSTLDFIPGNNFLGIVAASYNTFTKGEQIELFHNGCTRFGDAHPVENGSITRTLRVPASMFYPKLSKPEEKCYIHHFYKRENDHEGTDGNPQQLKQCRQGFYAFTGNTGQAVDTPKSFAIKSAYDRTTRRSADSMMYGYESLAEGREFLFEVECDNEALAKTVIDALVGTKHIGRSRTAQYGLVEISCCEYDQPSSQQESFCIEKDNYISVYADGRLIFFDEYGQTTFQPQAKDFGIDGEIDWRKSQVRTFQYAPWNAKRQTRDADRCGIEKGSVFIIRLNPDAKISLSNKYVGAFNNEGFGKIIFNPHFLESNGSNGLASVTLSKAKNNDTIATNTASHCNTMLLKHLRSNKADEDAEKFIYESVNKFVKDNIRLFQGKTFASQWGKIRSIAMQCSCHSELMEELFNKKYTEKREATVTNTKTSVTKETAYLAHGIAAEKWSKQRRKNKLEDFINAINNAGYGDITCKAVINLASAMAKIKEK